MWLEMRLSAFEAVIQALHQAQLRYLVAGGVAVNAHGYIHYIPDIDLAIDLIADNILSAIQALATIGYRSTIPIDTQVLAVREMHTSEKLPVADLIGFQSDDSEPTNVNLFATSDTVFRHEHAQALWSEILPGVVVRFLSIDALIRQKQITDRPRDQDDVQHLQWLQEDYSHIEENDEDFLWSMKSFEGARKMQLIQVNKLTVRQRIEGLDDLRQVCEHLQKMRLVPVLRESSAGEKRRPNS